MLKQAVKPEQEVFWLYHANHQYWEIANDLRGDFAPSTVTQYISRIVESERFRQTYRHFMEFADAAHNAKRK